MNYRVGPRREPVKRLQSCREISRRNTQPVYGHLPARTVLANQPGGRDDYPCSGRMAGAAGSDVSAGHQ